MSLEKLKFEDGGRPVTNTDLQTLQNLSLTLSSAILQGLSTCVLSGCRVTAAGTPDRYNIEAGIVWLSNGVYEFEGATSVTLPGEFVIGPIESVVDRLYQTGGTKTCITRQVAMLDVPNGVGPYTIEPGGPLMWYERVAALQRPYRQVEFGEWSLGDYPDGLGIGRHRGWAIPDGRNGTTNMAGRFPVIIDATAPDYDTAGKTGGAAVVSLTANQNGPHNHAPNGPFEYNQLVRKAPLGSTSTVTSTDGNGNGNGGEPDLRTTQQLQPSGQGEPHENRPPYYVLCARQWIGL